MTKKLTLIIPAFNEAQALELHLPELIKSCEYNKWNLILVNDCSFDETFSLINQHKDKSFLQIINHKVNKGYGAAIKSAISICDTDYLITLDADGQHSLQDVKRLYDKILETDADMIVGSRKNLKNQNLYRRLGKALIRFTAGILLPLKIYDINSGMKIYNTVLAKKYINFCPDSMAYSDIITLVFISRKHLVIEEPISINPRIAGKSKITTLTAFETLKEILNIVVLFNPMKIFLPVSMLSILAGLGWGLPFIILGRGISIGALLAIITGIIFFLLGLIAEQLSMIRKNQ